MARNSVKSCRTGTAGPGGGPQGIYLAPCTDAAGPSCDGSPGNRLLKAVPLEGYTAIPDNASFHRRKALVSMSISVLNISRSLFCFFADG